MKEMRSENELMTMFKSGEEDSAAYRRERAAIEVMFDVRSLLSQLVSLEKEKQTLRDAAKAV